MAEVCLVDVSIRDGNQCMWSATGLRTPQIVQAAPLLERVGFHALDYISSTFMGIAVRMHREDPWERIRLTRAAAPTTHLQFIGTGFRFISWEEASADLMQLIYDRLVVAGISRFVVLDPMHDVDAMRRSAAMVKRAGAPEVMGALTFTLSPVHDDAFYAGIARLIAQDPHFDRAYIKDPTGTLDPERAGTLVPAVKAALGAKPLELHSHCTIGLSPITYPTAPDLGIDVLHVAPGPLSNGSSLPDAQQVVANLRELGHTVDVDDRALSLVADYFRDLATAEGLPAGAPQDYDAAFLRHQVAGGTLTTTRRHLREVGLEDRFDEVIEEVPRVRAELGYPIMVTPFPQMVCTQALYNVLGTERYENVPDEVVRYVLGRFGRPTSPVDPEVKDRILSRPRAKELEAEPPPPTVAELRRRFPGVSDEELALRATMPGEQVDAMRAAGPARRQYNPRLRPLLGLIEELGRRPALSELAVERPGMRLRLVRRAHVAEGPVHADPATNVPRRPAVVHDPGAVARLRELRAFLLDLDGTLVLGDQRNHGLIPLPGAVELVDALHEHGVGVGVLTNGTARPPAAQAAVLRSIGFDLADDAVLTPASAAAEVCLHAGHSRVMVLGGQGVSGPLADAGIEVLPPDGRPKVDAVFVGWFREFSMDHLEAAANAVWGGAAFYSASQSLFFATVEGRAIGTSRAICAVVTDLTGVRPTIVGKPSRHALRTALRRLGVRPRELAVVGDDPTLEVPMALRGGAFAVAVNTGTGHAASFDNLEPGRRPHLVVDGVEDLLKLYRAAV
jgi:oxaloacetate decarboxylase (Na+ extruding) subunit alpha